MYCDKSTHDYVDGSTWNQAWIHGQVCVGSQASGVGDGVFTVDPNKGFQNGNCNNRCAWGDDTCSAGGDVVENSFGCWAGSGICSYQFGQCIVENCGAGETCMDAACVPALCNAGNEGTACSGDSWDTANHYCSTGLADGPGAGNCCPNGEYWDGARCIDSNECYSNPCPYLPGTSNWWASSACVNGGQTCCSISGGKYGISPYYDYQNIVVYS